MGQAMGMGRSISHKICEGRGRREDKRVLGVPPGPKSIAPMARRGGSKQTPNKQSSRVMSNLLGVMHNDLIRLSGRSKHARTSTVLTPTTGKLGAKPMAEATQRLHQAQVRASMGAAVMVSPGSGQSKPSSRGFKLADCAHITRRIGRLSQRQTPTSPTTEPS